MAANGLDRAFWAMAEPMWSELAAKPIIMSEPTDNPTIRRAARLLIKNGELGDNVRGFVHRKLANNWDLEPQDVDCLIEMQAVQDREVVIADLRAKGYFKYT